MELGKLVLFLKRKWFLPALSVLIITALCFTQLTDLDFSVDFQDFLPDSDTVRAKEDLDELFSGDSSVHLILLTENNADDDVLAPASVRAGYLLSRELQGVSGVDSVNSIYLGYDRIFDMLTGIGLMDASDSAIVNLTSVFHRVVRDDNGSVFLNFALSDYNYSAPQVNSTAEDIRDYSDVFLSGDFKDRGDAGRTLAVLFLESDLAPEERKAVVKDVMDTCAGFANNYGSGNFPLKAEHTGEDLFLLEMDEEIDSNKIVLGLFALAFTSLVLFLSFRRFTRVIFPLLTLGCALAWTFGLPGFFGMETSPLDLAVVPLVAGLGIDYMFHLLKRYDEEICDLAGGSTTPFDEGESSSLDIYERALSLSVGKVKRPVILASFTTVVAFLTALFSPVEAVANFGIKCTIGIVITLLLSFFFLLPLCIFIEHRLVSKDKCPNPKDNRTPYFIGHTMNNISRGVTVYPVFVVIGILLVSTFSLIYAVDVEKSFETDDIISNDLDARATEHTLNKYIGASSQSRVYYYYRGDGEPGVELVNDMAEKLLYVEEAPHVVMLGDLPHTNSLLDIFSRAISHSPELAEKYSFSGKDHLPLTNCTDKQVEDFVKYLENNSTSYGLLEDSTFSDMIGNVFQRHGKGYSALIEIFVYVDTYGESSSLVYSLKSALENEDSSGEIDITLTGLAVMTVETVDGMQDTMLYGTLAAFLVGLIVLVAVYRKVSSPFLAMLPVVVSTLWILGFMSMFSISLNILTITITSLVIGIGLDYSIHIVERYEQERKKHDPEKSLKRTLKYTGSSIFLSAFTTICGFLILLSSSLPVMRTYGLISGIAVLFSFILSCVVVPIILLKTLRKKTV